MSQLFPDLEECCEPVLCKEQLQRLCGVELHSVGAFRFFVAMRGEGCRFRVRSKTGIIPFSVARFTVSVLFRLTPKRTDRENRA